jgi:hypothetical protein
LPTLVGSKGGIELNALEERMLALLASKVRKRPEIVADLESVTTQIKTLRQSQEDWIQLAEKLTPSAELAGQPGDGA